MEQTFTAAGNPIVRHVFTSDPCALVHDRRLYVYTGRDEAPIGHDGYVLTEWLCFSTPDLLHWTAHGVPLRPTDFAWATGDAYASKVVEHGGRFYWYAPVTHATIPGKAIGVAVSDRPTGPFRDARGSALITNDMTSAAGGVRADDKDDIDPTVLIDDDGQAHLFWGNGRCHHARLAASLVDLDGPIAVVDLPDFAEGAHIHKRDGWYYLAYGYQNPEKVGYSMSRDVDGPWEFQGVLNDVVENCETNRAAIVDFRGKSYLIYHNGALPTGGSHRRSICMDELHYNPDGTLRRVVMTTAGVAAVAAADERGGPS